MSEVVQIPLRNRSGRVIASALVDVVDGERIGAHRWHMCGGYPSRSAPKGAKPRTIYMHREVLGLVDPKLKVDHINRNALDNRRVNLRVGTQAMNAQNRSPDRRGSSVFRGVRRQGSRWQAKTIHGHLGTFWNEVAAARAVEAYRRKHMPWAEPDPMLVALDEPEPDLPEAA